MTRRGALVALAGIVVLAMARPTSANIVDQRSRLPPPAECRHPIAGTWMSHAFFASTGRWHRDRMVLRPIAGAVSAVESEYLSESWNGAADEAEPRGCRPGFRWETGHSTGEGELLADGETVRIRGTRLLGTTERCGLPPREYILNELRGRLLRDAGEIHVTWQIAVERTEVLVFRRVACSDEEAAAEPAVIVQPPPVPPPPAMSQGGCGCGPF